MVSEAVSDDFAARTINVDGFNTQMIRFLAAQPHEEPYVAGRMSLDRVDALNKDVHLHWTGFSCASGRLHPGKPRL